MFTCVIVDDEPLAQNVIEKFIKEAGEIKLLNKFSNAHEALDFLSNEKTDILFLDIEMPEMNGVSLLKKLKDPPITVFVTAYRDYAYEGYELGVIDYLLKPVPRHRFFAALEKIQDFLLLKKQQAKIERSEYLRKYIFIKTGVERIKVFFDEITHIQGLKDYAIIHLKEKKKVVTKGSVKTMQEIFPEDDFVRVHKSFIVSRKYLTRISRNKILINELQIPIGISYKDVLERIIKTPKQSRL